MLEKKFLKILERLRLFLLLPGNNEYEYKKLYLKYSKTDRFVKANINTSFGVIVVPDIHSFLDTYREIFVKKMYHFTPSLKDSVVVDCGSNIGLSIIYFSTLSKNCHIVGFEPDKEIFKILEKNILAAAVENVEIYNAAVWTEDTQLTFYPDGSDGGSVFTNGDKRGVLVNAIDLKKILNKYESIDMLKIDIEGPESMILHDCENYLKKIKTIFIEYHSFVNKPQELGKILSLLEKNGYRYYIHNNIFSPEPIKRIGCSSGNGMDLQVGIIATKHEKGL